MCGCPPARRIDHTRLQLGQLEEVAPVERKRVDLLATDHGGYLMMVLVQTGHDALDDNGFVHIADLHVTSTVVVVPDSTATVRSRR